MTNLDRDDARWREIAGRQALGEPLAPDDDAFRRAHEARHPDVAAEAVAFAAVLDQLRRRADAPVAGDPDLLIDRALAALDAEHPADRAPLPLPLRPARPAFRPAVAAAAGLALAAGLAGLWLLRAPGPAPAPGLAAPGLAARPAPAAPGLAARPSPAQPAPPAPVATPGPLDPVLITMSAGSGLTRQGEPLAVGDRLAEGDVLDARGEACLAFAAPHAVVCLDAGARLRLDAARAGQRRLVLGRGRLVAALDPLAPGQAFAVVTPAGAAHVVGTVFAVAVDDDARAAVGVLEGKVELRPAAGLPARSLLAGEHARLDDLAPGPLPAPLAAWAGARAQLADLWRLGDPAAPLAGLAGLTGLALPVGDPAALALDDRPLAPGTAEVLVPPGAHRLAAGRPGRPQLRSIDAVAGQRSDLALELPRPPRALPRPASPAPTAAELRDRAQDARAAGRWRDAADAYAELLDRHPGAPEAQNARLQLGDLLRARLGDPAAALRHFDAYLARGGPLDAEARHGAILCLRALGRGVDERAAIAAFLARHPDHLEAADLRRRAADLEGR